MGASGNEIAQELQDFMKQNPLFDIDMGDLILDTPQTRALFNSNLSVEEFKEKWLELKEQIAQGKEAMNANSTSTQSAINLTASQSEEKKTFTPIQAESSRETYKDLSGAKNLELAKMEQMRTMLDILFNQKAGENSIFGLSNQNMGLNSTLPNLDFSNSTFSNSTFKEVQKFINSRGGIDLRA